MEGGDERLLVGYQQLFLTSYAQRLQFESKSSRPKTKSKLKKMKLQYFFEKFAKTRDQLKLEREWGYLPQLLTEKIHRILGWGLL